MIAIVDYGMGNLLSVLKAFEYLGEDASVVSDPLLLKKAERIVLPGVGAFPDAMAVLQRDSWLEVLRHQIIEEKKPFLGICLGMQLLAQFGEENILCEGMGLLKGRVSKLLSPDKNYKIPHVGWNNIEFIDSSPLFRGISQGATFYFVHSYCLSCEESQDVLATCEHGCKFIAAVQKENIFATQFHPEKSQDNGLKLLENFVDWSL